MAAINKQMTGGTYGYIERFNDDKRTRRKDVLDVIDGALGEKK